MEGIESLIVGVVVLTEVRHETSCIHRWLLLHRRLLHVHTTKEKVVIVHWLLLRKRLLLPETKIIIIEGLRRCHVQVAKEVLLRGLLGLRGLLVRCRATKEESSIRDCRGWLLLNNWLWLLRRLRHKVKEVVVALLWRSLSVGNWFTH